MTELTYGDTFGDTDTKWDETTLAGKRDSQRTKELRALARKLERLLARRRRLNKTLRAINDEVRQTRRFLNQM